MLISLIPFLTLTQYRRPTDITEYIFHEVFPLAHGTVDYLYYFMLFSFFSLALTYLSDYYLLCPAFHISTTHFVFCSGLGFMSCPSTYIIVTLIPRKPKFMWQSGGVWHQMNSIASALLQDFLHHLSDPH